MFNFTTELENATFNELKYLLKTEYLANFTSFVEWSVTEKERLLKERFGEDFLKNQERYDELKKQIDDTFDEFYKSENYKNAQQLVSALNQKLSTCLESDKKQIEEDVKKALSKIETLNVTIKNRTQKEREELEELKKSVEKIKTEFKSEIEQIDNKIQTIVINKLTESVEEYNYLLNGLCSIYDEEPPYKKEYPFTEDELLDYNETLDSPKGVIEFIKNKMQN